MQELHINRTGTVKEPVCCSAVAKAFERFWKVYPRPRDKAASLKEFTEAVSAGAKPEAIIQAARAYALDNRENVKGQRRQYIAYSDNWLRSRRWEDADAVSSAAPAVNGVSDIARFWAEKINAGAFVPSGAVSQEIAAEIAAAGLVAPDRLRRAAG